MRVIVETFSAGIDMIGTSNGPDTKISVGGQKLVQELLVGRSVLLNVSHLFRTAIRWGINPIELQFGTNGLH